MFTFLFLFTLLFLMQQFSFLVVFCLYRRSIYSLSHPLCLHHFPLFFLLLLKNFFIQINSVYQFGSYVLATLNREIKVRNKLRASNVLLIRRAIRLYLNTRNLFPICNLIQRQAVAASTNLPKLAPYLKISMNILKIFSTSPRIIANKYICRLPRCYSDMVNRKSKLTFESRKAGNTASLECYDSPSI